MENVEKKSKELVKSKEQEKEWRKFIFKVFVDAEKDHAGEMHFVNFKNKMFMAEFEKQKEYIWSLDKGKLKEFRDGLVKKMAQEFVDFLTFSEMELYVKINNIVDNYKGISYPEKLIPQIEELKNELNILEENLFHELEFAYDAHNEIKKLKNNTERIIEEAKRKGKMDGKTMQTIQSETRERILPFCLEIRKIKEQDGAFRKFEFREMFLAYIKTEINLWINLEFRRSIWSDK